MKTPPPMFTNPTPGSIHPANFRLSAPAHGAVRVTPEGLPAAAKNRGGIGRPQPPWMGVFVVALFVVILCASVCATASGSANPALQQPEAAKTPIDLELLILKHSIDCHDIAAAATKLITLHHGQEQPDTLDALLPYWRAQCGLVEPLMRYLTLTGIGRGTFHENQLPARILDYLDDYMDAAVANTGTLPDYFFDFQRGEYVAMHYGFNGFTAALSEQIRELGNLQPVELFFADFYANDFEEALLRLEGGQLSGTMIDSLYRLDNPLRETPEAMRARRRLPLPEDGVGAGYEEQPEEAQDLADPGREREVPVVREAPQHRQPDADAHASDPGAPGTGHVRPRERPSLHWGGTLGWWSPVGKLRTLGHHPQAGFIAGGTMSGFLLGFQMSVGFLNTPVHYVAIVDGELYETRHFTQVYLGAHGGVRLFSDPLNALYVTAGAGYDGIDPLNYAIWQENSTDLSQMINSLNLNTGFTYKRTIGEQRFFSVMLRYNFLNYRNRGGTDLSGDVITVGFAYGINERW